MRNNNWRKVMAGFAHLRLSDLGMAKGQTPANDANVEKVAAKGRTLI